MKTKKPKKNKHYFVTRAMINDYLNRTKVGDPNFYFLHCDSWHFKANYRCVNCGIQEPNMMNIAAGLLGQGKTVVIYGIAGFVLEKCMEQLRLVQGDYGKMIILNAGNHHEYPESLGRGHFFDVNKIEEHLRTECNIDKISDLTYEYPDLEGIFEYKSNNLFRTRHLVLLGFEK